MAKLSQLQQAYQNPNMRKFLDFIAQAEGVKHGYNTMFGNERFGNLGAHPNVKKSFKQTDGTTNFTTAAGRYQFLKGTWDNLANQYGFKDFSPRAQDLGAIALISGRGALDDVLNGNWQGAIGKLGQEWASLPSSKYKQGKRSWEFANQRLGGGVQAQAFQPDFVDLKKVGIGVKNYQPQMVDLHSVGIGSSNQPSAYQPEMIDLKNVGIG